MQDQSYSIRELKVKDYENGFLDCLTELTIVGDISKDKFIETFNKRKTVGVFTAVAVDDKTKKILGTGSVFYEPKFIRNCSWKAYIEDISVASHTQKRGVGKAIVSFLKDKALEDGCYKVVLTCNEKTKGFYEKNNFKQIEDAMAIYSEKKE